MTEKLKACPCHFCGSTATSAAFFRASDDYQGWQVECSSCGGSGPMNMNTEAEAITAWNTSHPTPTNPESLVEALRQADVDFQRTPGTNRDGAIVKHVRESRARIAFALSAAPLKEGQGE